MTVEFISAINTRPGDELNPQRGGAPFDPAYLRRYARTLDDAGFDYTLVPYGSPSADSFVVATAVAAATERIKPIVAVRPNTVFPTVAAQQLATLDQVSQGRAVVRIISGGSDAEQARQGDFLSKDERYDRSEEWIRIVPSTAPRSRACSSTCSTSWSSTPSSASPSCSPRRAAESAMPSSSSISCARCSGSSRR